MNQDEFTLQEFYLEVGSGHRLYCQDWGQADAKTVIINLHGGPGGGSHDSQKQRYEPTRQRVIFFDQRGAGQSQPFGSTSANTTQDLVADINKLADHLDLSRFVLCGRSWGSLLALCYAIEHPERLQALVVGGILLGTKAEKDYLNKGGFKDYFPDAWNELLAAVPKSHQDSPLDYLAQQVAGASQPVEKAARVYSRLTSSLMRLDERGPADPGEFELAPLAIELNYFLHDYYLPANYVLKNASDIKLPVWIIQGRFDMLCPPASAYALHQALPNSNLLWTMAGHGNDRSNFDVLKTVLLSLTG